DSQRRVLGLDLQLHVAIGSEPERLEAPVLAAIRAEHVLHAFDRLAVDLVAVALEPTLVLERLRIGQADRAALATTRLQHRVGVREVSLVEQEPAVGACGHHEIALALEERLARVDAARAADASEAYGFLLHRRDGARSELPASCVTGEVGAAKLGSLAAGPAPGGRGGPGGAGGGDLP